MNDKVLNGPGVRRGLFESFLTCLANSGLSCITNLPSGNSRTWTGLSSLAYRSAMALAMDRIFSSDLAPITDPIVLKSSGLPETYRAASQSCCCNADILAVGSVCDWASIVYHFDTNISGFFCVH